MQEIHETSKESLHFRVFHEFIKLIPGCKMMLVIRTTNKEIIVNEQKRVLSYLPNFKHMLSPQELFSPSLVRHIYLHVEKITTVDRRIIFYATTVLHSGV